MKSKAIVLAVFMIATAAFAADTVTSVNVVGYVKKWLETDEWMLAGLNFDKTGGGAHTLGSLFGTNQLHADQFDLTKCDRIIMWVESNQVYQTYAQRPDGNFYLANNSPEWFALTQADPEVAAGVGFWVAPAVVGAVGRDLMFTGDAVNAATQKVDLVGSNVWQLLSYPFTAKVTLQDTSFFDSGAAYDWFDATKADRLIVWLGDKYQTYALRSNGLWYAANNAPEWFTFTKASNTLELAEGFWYVGVGNSVVEWEETNTYIEVFSNE